MAGQGSILRRALALSVVAAYLLVTPVSGTAAPAMKPVRPGPDILYAPPVTAPQLQNTGIWQAPPILVSGTTAYRDREFLYQDWIYDDHGANGGFLCCRDNAGTNTPGGSDQPPGNGGQNLIGPTYGTYTYPQDPMFAHNAADIVEIRTKPLADATAFRVTFNTLTPALAAAGRIAFTIALGQQDPATHAFPPVAYFPHLANSRADADRFLTVQVKTSGGFAELTHGVSATHLSPPVVDVARHQVEVRVPHATWNPGSAVVRMTAGAGVWLPVAKEYLGPAQNSTTDTPGGKGTLTAPSVFFNIAFRDTRQGRPNSEEYHPLQGWDSPTASVITLPTWWRDYSQGNALEQGDISAFHADVDFGRMLGPNPGDDSAIPTTGPMNRLLSSHFDFGPGVDFSQESATPSCTATAVGPCLPAYLGPLQPYTIYIPATHPASGYGLTVQPHALSANYNQYYATRNESELGDRGSIVITGEARGPDGWYWGAAGADPFEIWADVARRYPVDPNWVNITGFSMGGYATFKFTTSYPDLFAAAFTTVGVPGMGIWVPPSESSSNPGGGAQTLTYDMLPSVRHIPFMIWNSVGDELVPYASATFQANKFDSLGYRYEWWSFVVPPLFPVFPGHIGLGANDAYQPAADFLGQKRLVTDPAHVTYVRNPKMDYPQYGMVADHAYWVSGVKLRDGSGEAPRGQIDVRSEAFGTGDPVPGATQRGAGLLTGGSYPGGVPYVSQGKAWGAVPSTPVENVLDITTSNVSEVTIDVARARVDCGVKLNIAGDGPLKVHLAGCDAVNAAGPPPAGLPNTSAGLPAVLVVVAAAAFLGSRRRRRLA